MKSISERIDGCRQDLRELARSASFSACSVRRFEYDGIEVAVIDGPRLVVNGTNASYVEMTLRATVDGEDVPLDNPFLFVNPPYRMDGGDDDRDAVFVEAVGQAVALATRGSG